MDYNKKSFWDKEITGADVAVFLIIVAVIAGVVSLGYFLYSQSSKSSGNYVSCDDEWTTHHGRSRNCDDGGEYDYQYEPGESDYPDEYQEQLLEQYEEEYENYLEDR
jgi:hypothetical protein